ncbi:PspC domain-containing protein [Gracilibacillus sp. S3-1-1]|uniref:PspC domain-containing protein n=1 Tax=Gracilibacillus pellucidus TaxID=3095368 RepID=A0ACC6M1A5_9BACI|nr:PspC domain-containing protein [Gracilibacillus sp. S3-1-1]MDX8044657.1 PspC domain-containing protein [Gracilibacillus sp. S3-1-1]
MERKLYRSNTNVMISGVLGGIAEMVHLDATILRLIFVLLLIFTYGVPLFLLYVAATIIIPKRGGEY